MGRTDQLAPVAPWFHRWLGTTPEEHALVKSTWASNASVGLLWVVYQQSLSAKGRLAKNYLAQAIASARSARALNPDLRRAISTNVPGATNDLRSTFDVVLPMASMRGAQVRSTWLPRLLALAASPFDLTLEIDATATICSALLHHALLREHRRNRFDLAVNFEASPLVPPDGASMFSSPPSRLSDILPHNFALLVRKGSGWRALLDLWMRAMATYPDDQVALQAMLRRLEHDGFRVHLTSAKRAGAGDGGAGGARSGRTVRVWRLTEAFLGFKSVDKRRPNWRMVWPRYSRPIDGPVHLVHSYDAKALGTPAASRRRAGICSCVNERDGWRRIVVQSRSGRPYLVHLVHSACIA